jgi:SEC-C motif-containing protein
MASFRACPCGRPAAYEGCCGRFIDGGEPPETAEELMRSRYTAYTRQAIDYLLQTQHPSRPDQRRAIARWAEAADFVGLEVRSTEKGGPADQEGTVEFIARFRQDGEEHQHHERSSFHRRRPRPGAAGSGRLSPAGTERGAARTGR